MMPVATDGYILAILGLFLTGGKNSDAEITEHMLKSNSNIPDFFSKKMISLLIVVLRCNRTTE